MTDNEKELLDALNDLLGLIDAPMYILMEQRAIESIAPDSTLALARATAQKHGEKK